MEPKKSKPKRPDQLLTQKMPERIKKLNTLHRATVRQQTRAAWVKKNQEGK